MSGRISLLILLAMLFLFYPRGLFANSNNYVLPYPPSMPGSSFYKFRITYEYIQSYWYFGNIAQFTYNLKLSDKYLVEAKTLFEYKQYLLGLNALNKSTSYFKKSSPFLVAAKKEGKNVKDKEALLKNAGLKHVDVLKNFLLFVPKEVTWYPENQPPSTLSLHTVINSSISARRTLINE